MKLKKNNNSVSRGTIVSRQETTRGEGRKRSIGLIHTTRDTYYNYKLEVKTISPAQCPVSEFPIGECNN